MGIDLEGVFRLIAIIGCIIAVWVAYSFYVIYLLPAEIKSDKPITPEIELIIKNNQLDTIYIYKNDN